MGTLLQRVEESSYVMTRRLKGALYDMFRVEGVDFWLDNKRIPYLSGSHPLSRSSWVSRMVRGVPLTVDVVDTATL